MFFAEIGDCCSVVEIFAILRQDEENLVEDSNMAVLERLRSRLDKFDSAREGLEKGASIDRYGRAD